MKNFSTPELLLYAGASALYWWLVYVAVRLAQVLRCGLGPDSPSSCSAGNLPYAIGVVAVAIYSYLVWLTNRNA